MQPSISFIIPNFNGAQILPQTLPAIITAAANYQAQIIIVDDASTDHSLQLLQTHFPQITVITQTVNQGFSSTVNRGVAATQTDLICLINSDVIPTPRFLDSIFTYFDNPQTFAVGLTEIDDQGNYHQPNSFSFHRGLIQGQEIELPPNSSAMPTTPQPVTTAWVSGGSGVFKRSIWLHLNGLDQTLNPFYQEDLDLGYRAWKSGYSLYLEPQSTIRHFHNQGSIKSNYTQQKILTTSYRNQLLITWKNLTSLNLIVIHLLWQPVILFLALKNQQFLYLHGTFQAFQKIPAILQQRKNNLPLFVQSDHQLFNQFK